MRSNEANTYTTVSHCTYVLLIFNIQFVVESWTTDTYSHMQQWSLQTYLVWPPVQPELVRISDLHFQEMGIFWVGFRFWNSMFCGFQIVEPSHPWLNLKRHCIRSSSRSLGKVGLSMTNIRSNSQFFCMFNKPIFVFHWILFESCF